MYILARGEYLGYDWLVIGMLKLLVLIATLQLVKKLPDIINGIFGTQLKWQGGVKGRLGEMIGIGGLAQKAWSSLGTGAKNAAKLLAQAPIGAAYVAADKKYFKNKGEHLKNTAAFRQGKGILFGARAGLKSGSLMDAYQGYEQSRTLSALTKADAQFVADRARESLGQAGFTSGYYDNSSTIHASGFKDENDHNDNVRTIMDASARTLRSKQGQKLDANLRTLDVAAKQANLAEGIQSSKDKIYNNWLSNLSDTLKGSQYTETERATVNGIISRFKNGDGIIDADGAEILKKYMSDVDAKDFQKAVLKNDRNVMEYAARYDVDEADLRSSIKLGDIVKNAQATVEQIENDGKRIMDDANTTEAEKITYEEYSAGIKKIREKTWGAVQNSDTSSVSDSLAWARDNDYSTSGTATHLEREAEEAAQRQATEAAQRQAEIAQLNTENESISNEMMDSFINDSPAAAQRRDEIRNRKREIEARLKELNNQNNQ